VKKIIKVIIDMGNSSELFKVKTLSQALDLLKPHATFFESTEEVPLKESLGRIVAKDLYAGLSLPHFRKSTVDGIAVRSVDTYGANEGMPALVEQTGEIFMGKPSHEIIQKGQGMLIPTGGMLPEGSDAVVMKEYLEDFGSGLFGVMKAAASGENIIDVGEDFQEGEKILEKYSKIRAQEMGLLASQGIISVPVFPRVRVGILSTGDEIVSPSVFPALAQTRDINGYTLLGQALALGTQAQYYGIVADDEDELRKILQRMLSENDIILLSGGSSVGARDLSAQLIEELGEPGLLFHGLALRPGKPTIGGVVGGKLIFGLPGHPASAMVVFDNIVRPWLDASLFTKKDYPYPEGILTQNLYSGSGREEFVRVHIKKEEDDWLVEPIHGKSGLIRTMTLADGLVHIELDTEGIEAGKKVKIRLLR
jgi:molybdopterin molybdotransferase